MKHLFLLTGMLLAACSQNPDGTTAVGVKGSPAWFATATPDVIAAHYRATCAAYGHQSGTAEMTRCIERNAVSARETGSQAFSESMFRFSEQQYARANSYRNYAPSYSRSVSCTSYSSPYSNYTKTNCY